VLPYELSQHVAVPTCAAAKVQHALARQELGGDEATSVVFVRDIGVHAGQRALQVGRRGAAGGAAGGLQVSGFGQHFAVVVIHLVVCDAVTVLRSLADRVLKHSRARHHVASSDGALVRTRLRNKLIG